MAYYYKHLGDFLQAMREQRRLPVDRNTMNAWNRIVGTVSGCVDYPISDENTELIADQFRSGATDLAETTVNNYVGCFRKGVRHFMDYIDISGGAELDGLPAWLELTDSQDNPAQPEPVAEPEEEPEEEDAPIDTDEPEYDEEPQMDTYKFLLRPGITIDVPIPDDLTANEVKRFTTWLGTFVISGRR